MFKEKPVISNQHGALAMAMLPFLYAVIESGFSTLHIFFGLSWLFLYFFSYPFLSLFSKKPTERNKKWAKIYFGLSILFALPLIYAQPSILQFLPIILPLGLVQVHYAKQKDERNLWNDIAGILTFGIMGMAAYYLVTKQYQFEILLHPTLFFYCYDFLYKEYGARAKKPNLYGNQYCNTFGFSNALHTLLSTSGLFCLFNCNCPSHYCAKLWLEC